MNPNRATWLMITAMLTLLFGFGLVLNVYIHRDIQIGRRLHHIRA